MRCDAMCTDVSQYSILTPWGFYNCLPFDLRCVQGCVIVFLCILFVFPIKRLSHGLQISRIKIVINEEWGINPIVLIPFVVFDFILN